MLLNVCICSNKCFLFTDDLKIYKQITSLDDSRMPQNGLHFIHKWCINNNMILNTNKCFHVSFTKKKESHTIHVLNWNRKGRIVFILTIGQEIGAMITITMNKHFEF